MIAAIFRQCLCRAARSLRGCVSPFVTLSQPEIISSTPLETGWTYDKEEIYYVTNIPTYRFKYN